VFLQLKDYFQFNKKERNGILLLSFILLLTIIYYNIMYLFTDKQKTDFSEFDNLIPETEDVIKKQQTDSLFVFNPNTLNDKGWSMLGLTEKQISIFRNYQSSGIVFYATEDLSKCYAISDDFINRVTDFIIFSQRKEKKEKVKIQMKNQMNNYKL